MPAVDLTTVGPVPVETYGLTHLALAVADPARSARFYQDVFGCVVSAGDGVQAIELQTPGRKDVISMERAESGATAPGTPGGAGHFGFRLVRPEDIDAAVDAVLDAGGSVDRRGEFSPGYPFAMVRDLDGYLLEIWFE
jgi:catechol 2,3-dioxygenase-like lactoylglutathione lyase family enzyme